MDLFKTSFETTDFTKARTDIASVGWSFLGKPLPTEALDIMRDQIDVMAEAPDTEVNYAGSEHRIWKAHEKSPGMEQFRQFSDAVRSAVEGKPTEAYDILAIRNRQIDTSATKLVEGRWHLDSLNRQIKVFVFLTDVTEESGPFEMLPGTQAMSFKVKEAMKGNMITPSDLVKGTRSYSKLKEELIQTLVAAGHDKKVFTVPAGTIALVDTSCVHRARPCAEGHRYALTSYYH